MSDGKLRLCGRGHNLDVVGQTSARQCRACKRDQDRARDKLRRERRRFGDEPARFKPGEGHIFLRGRFGWEEPAFTTPGRLKALARWVARPSGNHTWQNLAVHALRHLKQGDAQTYQEEFYPDLVGGYFLASDELMQWDERCRGWRIEEGDGFRFEAGRFGWEISKFPGACEALLTTSWWHVAHHALEYIKVEGVTPAQYLDVVSDEESDGYAWMTESMMQFFFDLADAIKAGEFETFIHEEAVVEQAPV